jgi:BMFP domain-containing protein YqiC
MPARDMAAYMRGRRARQKAEREAAEPVVDITIPRNALLKESDKELSRVRAKVDAIGPGAVITKTHGRLDVLTREDFESRGSAPSREAVYKRPTPAAAPRSATRREYVPPVSMVAIGGKPGHGLVPQGRGSGLPPDLAAHSPYTRAEEFRAHTTTMLAALAARADAQDRRIAALEAAAADRRVNALDVAHALGGIFKFALTGRG